MKQKIRQRFSAEKKAENRKIVENENEIRSASSVNKTKTDVFTAILEGFSLVINIYSLFI